jgi:hypothetical protein
MSYSKILLDFATSAVFQWIALSIGALGTIFGVVAWLDGRRKDRIYKYLFEAAEKNIDRDVTEEQLDTKKSEVSRVSDQISELRRRIEIEIPLEAKRTALKDRIDGNLVTLQHTLASTLELQTQLIAVGEHIDLPPDLIKAVEAEILPEYVENSRRETLKSYLLILMAIWIVANAILPDEIGLIIRVPLLVFAGFIVVRLVKTYGTKVLESGDQSTLAMIAYAIYTGALTAAFFCIAVMWQRLPEPHHRWKDLNERDIFPFILLLFGLALVGAGIFAIARKRSVIRIIAAAFAIFLGLVAFALTGIMMNSVNDLPRLLAAYMFALGTFAFAFFATILLIRSKRRTSIIPNSQL